MFGTGEEAHEGSITTDGAGESNELIGWQDSPTKACSPVEHALDTTHGTSSSLPTPPLNGRLSITSRRRHRGREGKRGWFRTLGGREKYAGEFGSDWNTGRGRWGGGSRKILFPASL